MKNINWKECHQLIKLINDWFDLFNSSRKFGIHSGCNAFGTDIINQTSLLNNVTSRISSLTVGKQKSLMPFQKGILLNNTSLLQMYTYLKLKYSVEYIITSHLNQDALENFFIYSRYGRTK